MSDEKDYITLKWGTLKGWKVSSPAAMALLTRYHELGACVSAMMQKDTPEQKEIICSLIDECGGDEVCLDWDGKTVTNEEAKKYVRDYGVKREETVLK